MRRCRTIAGELLFAVGASVAGTASSASCTVSAVGVAFGLYNPFNATSNDSTGSIDVSCTTLIVASNTYTLALSAGNGTYANRKMTSGANTVLYNLFTDATYTMRWGDGTQGTQAISTTQLLALQTVAQQHYPVYGRMPARQTGAVAGNYADTVLVTISF